MPGLKAIYTRAVIYITIIYNLHASGNLHLAISGQLPAGNVSDYGKGAPAAQGVS